MDPGVKCLDAPAEHLGDAGELLDPLDVEARLRSRGSPQCRRSRRARSRGRRARARNPQARLVVDGDQCAHSSVTTSGRSSMLDCVDPFDAACRAARPLTGSCRITAPVSTPFVDVVDGRRRSSRTPAASASSIALRAGELRQERRVHVDDAVGEAVEKRRRAGGACSRRARPARRPRSSSQSAMLAIARLAVGIAGRARRRDSGCPLRRARSSAAASLPVATPRRRSAGRRRSAPGGSCPSPETSTPIIVERPDDERSVGRLGDDRAAFRCRG